MNGFTTELRTVIVSKKYNIKLRGKGKKKEKINTKGKNDFFLFNVS